MIYPEYSKHDRHKTWGWTVAYKWKNRCQIRTEGAEGVVAALSAWVDVYVCVRVSVFPLLCAGGFDREAV